VLSNNVNEEEFVPPVRVVPVALMLSPCPVKAFAASATLFNNDTPAALRFKVAPLPLAVTPETAPPTTNVLAVVGVRVLLRVVLAP
jgi:hypothetical protein